MKNRKLNPYLYRRPILVMIVVVLLAAVLAACGGDDGSQTEQTEPTVAVEAPPPVDEPTEEPASEPTAEPTAAPTAEPTDAPAAEPTDAPTEEAAEPSSGELVLTGDCGNAFYPVVEGRVYQYTTTVSALGESSFSTSFSDVSDSSFTLVNSVDGEPVTSTVWTCTADGLLSPEFSQAPAVVEGMTIEFVEASGLSIPTEDKFQVGETWTAHYVANVEMPDMGAGAMSMIQTIDITNETVAIEAVSVPAGDFPEAVRVDSVVTITMSFAVGGETQDGMGIDMTYSSWYVEGVGLVLSEVDDMIGMGGSRSELISYTD